MNDKRTSDEISLKSVMTRAAAVSATIALMACAAAYAFFTYIAAISIAAGWGSSLIAFIVLAVTIKKSFGGKNAQLAFSIFGMILLLSVGGALWILISGGYAHPHFFLAGFAITVISLLVESLRIKRALRSK